MPIDTENAARAENYGMTISQVAFASLMAVPFVLSLNFIDKGFLQSSSIWFLYIVACGLIIKADPQSSIQKIFKYAVTPSFTFLIAVSVLTVFDFLFENYTFRMCGIQFSKEKLMILIVFNVLLSLINIICISLAIYSRQALIQSYFSFKRTDIKDFKNFERKIEIIISIISLIIAGFLLVK